MKEKGCEWTDLITQVLPHIEECGFFPVQCPLGCVSEKEETGSKIVEVERRLLEEHQNNQCPMRLINCESCESPIRVCEMEKHIEMCEEYSIPCPNSCWEEDEIRKVKRKELPLHLGEECPLQICDCPFAEHGCTEKMERKFLKEHEEDHCPMRLINCESCDFQMRACVVNEHLSICEEYFILCPNSCIEGEDIRRVKRKHLPSHLEDCPLQEVECLYAEYGCKEKMERRSVEDHQKDHCLMRPVHCELCNNEMKACLMNEHIETCGEYLVLCPNSCAEEVRMLKRKDLPSHLEECPLQEIECPYAEFGCEEKMERKLLDQHVKESIHTHFRLTIVKMKEQSCKIELLEKENAKKDMKILRLQEDQSREISMLKTELECLVLRGSLKWKITGVTAKIQNMEESFSDIFNVGHYRFQCRIRWDCKGRGFMGCFLHIIRGDWDARLAWPFSYRRWFILVNQKDNTGNYIKYGEVSGELLQKFPSSFSQPTELRNDGFGAPDFISHDGILEEKYFSNDLIILKVFVERLPPKSIITFC